MPAVSDGVHEELVDNDAPMELTAARMRALGLDHEVFDPAATWADLAQRIAQSASLDALVSRRGGLDPTAFDPSWPSGDGACADSPT